MLRRLDRTLVVFAVAATVIVVGGWYWLWPQQRPGYVAGLFIMGALTLAWDWLDKEETT